MGPENNPGTGEAEAGGLRTHGQTEFHREIPCEEKKLHTNEINSKSSVGSTRLGFPPPVH